MSDGVRRTLTFREPAVRVLGAFELGPGERPIKVEGKVQRLLAMLIASVNESVTVDRLCDALWGTARPVTFESGLRGHLSRARVLLHQVGVEFSIDARPWGDAPAYCLAMSGADVDHTRFVELATRHGIGHDEVEDLEAALRLWRGDAFAGIALDDVSARVFQLDELRTAAAERLSVLYLARGRSSDAVSLLRPFLERHPDRESTTLYLARALYADDRHREALAVCQATATYLRTEFGLEPSTSLSDLEHLILDHDESLQPRPAHLDAMYLDALLQHARGPFVGRGDVMSGLRGLVDGTRDGVGGTVFLTGDIGTGKTRVLAETARHATRADLWCVHVAPFEPATEPFAFGRSLMRRLAAGPSSTLSNAADRAKEAFDEFARSSDRTRATEGLDLALDRLIDVIASRSEAIVIILDDLQWIDSSSLIVIRKLAKRFARHLGLVMAARSGSHTRSWDEFVAELPSTAIQTMVIEPLSTTEIAQWIAQMGVDLTVPIDTIAALVFKQTSGIAFLVAGVLDDLVTIGDAITTLQWLHDGHLPERLADPLRARIGRLDNRTIQLLAVAAVVSPTPEPAEVAGICRAMFGAGEWLIDERRALGLVRPNPGRPGTYVFEHALTRAVLQGLLSGDERRFVHRAAAENRMRGGEHASAVAIHLLEAIPLVAPIVALEATASAARSAAAVFAFDEAAVLFQKALAVQLASLPDDHATELDLRVGLLHAMQQLGARRTALPYFEETLSRAEALGLWDGVLACALAAADFGEVLDRDDPVRHLLVRALEALPSDHHGRALVAVEAIIKITIIEGNSAQVRTLYDDELGQVEEEVLIHERSRAWLHINAGSPNATARRETARELQRTTDDHAGRRWLDATLFLLSAELELGNTDRAERMLHRFRHAASQSGRPGVRWLALVAAADLVQLHGQLRTGQDLARRALDYGVEHEVPDAPHSYGGHSLVADILRGSLHRLETVNASQIPDSFENAVLASSLALILAATRRHTDAAFALSDAIATLRSIPTSTLTPFSIGLCAEAWLHLNRPSTVSGELLDLVTPYSGTMWRMALVGSSLGPVDRHRGALLASLADDGAAMVLDQAVEFARRAHAPIWHLASAVERARHSRQPAHLNEVARLARGPRVAEAEAVIALANEVLATG